MNLKKYKNILIIIVLLPIIYYSFVLLKKGYLGHSTTFDYDYKYNSFFKEKNLKYIIKRTAHIIKSKEETINSFHFISPEDTVLISIWEINELKNTLARNVPINKNMNLNNIEYESGEIFFPKAHCNVIVEYTPHYNNEICINLNSHSEILEDSSGLNFKMFYGLINTVGFGNDKKLNQTVIKSDIDKKQLAFILLNKNNSFYIILIRSYKNYFDQNIFEIFNLNQ